MPNTREKLIELLNEAEEHSTDVCCFNSTCEDCPGRKYGTKCRDYLKADHLIANGVGFREQDCHWATEQAYKNGKSDAMKWISVKDRLPVEEAKAHEQEWSEEYCEFLVMIERGLLPTTLYYDWENNEWFRINTALERETYKVTHWMPLPEPPKGE